ncbi:hypothetical protein [Enterovibrio norvegicus]|uniref:Uncharacterized protein n=2 Tax=Enterovibrio norvegicus TaxID=188144 RepID=A0A1I5TZ29_9GAMM|nr:hypothetical protein [Enterovibrio norvegicus]MCC4799842.1 hypothetical protein [Enterovibrio norvegicus]SFP88161.1 hypothetical protein SAMN03084138_03384 [Enterovibrio norvegicus DSM 15893]
MELENQFGEKMHLADDLTLKEMVDMGLLVVLADENDESENCWIPAEPFE